MSIQFEIVSLSMLHSGGTKEYHLLSIVNMTSKATIVVNRWGKKGSFGSLKVEQFHTSLAASVEFEKKRKEKENRGYRDGSPVRKTVDLRDLKAKIGPALWANLGAGNISFLHPALDTTGVREPKELRFEKDKSGRMRLAEEPPLLCEEEEGAPQADPETMANPNWGLF